MTTAPEPYPFPAEAMANFARSIVNDGQGNAYQRFRDACDRAILVVSPATPQTRFAKTLGMSRSTLRFMLRRLGLTATDGRRKS